MASGNRHRTNDSRSLFERQRQRVIYPTWPSGGYAASVRKALDDGLVHRAIRESLDSLSAERRESGAVADQHSSPPVG